MTAYGALGQIKPAAASLDVAYTVPTGKHATVRVMACNTGAGTSLIRVAVAILGAADSLKQYIAYDEPVTANTSVSSQPITLSAGDVIRARSDTGDVAFLVTGIQNEDA